MNFDDQQQQSSFKVLFFDQIIEDVAQLKQDFSEVQFGEDDYLPFTGQYSIKFELASQPISVEDEGFNIGSDDDDFYDAYSNTFASTGHRLGGYPFLHKVIHVVITKVFETIFCFSNLIRTTLRTILCGEIQVWGISLFTQKI